MLYKITSRTCEKFLTNLGKQGTREIFRILGHRASCQYGRQFLFFQSPTPGVFLHFYPIVLKIALGGPRKVQYFPFELFSTSRKCIFLGKTSKTRLHLYCTVHEENPWRANVLWIFLSLVLPIIYTNFPCCPLKCRKSASGFHCF